MRESNAILKVDLGHPENCDDSSRAPTLYSGAYGSQAIGQGIRSV
jgi:hypothetical protein